MQLNDEAAGQGDEIQLAGSRGAGSRDSGAHVRNRYVDQYALQLAVAQLRCAVDDMSALHEKSGIDLLKIRPGVGSHRSPGGDDLHPFHFPFTPH